MFDSIDRSLFVLDMMSLLQNTFFRESKRNRMQYEYESEREPRSILQVPLSKGNSPPAYVKAKELSLWRTVKA